MAQALIQVNGTTGSRQSVPLNTLVDLANLNVGGETTWAWAFVSRPLGSTASLTGPSTATPSFTPDVEGTYLLEVLVNCTLTNRAIVGVLQLTTGLRLPAYQEADEADTDPTMGAVLRGWDGASGAILKALTLAAGAPTYRTVAAAGVLAAGDLVKPTGQHVILSGLPDQRTLLVVDKALAVNPTDVMLDVWMVIDAVGGGSIVANTPIRVLECGFFGPVSLGASAGIQGVFVSNTGVLSKDPGDNARAVAYQFAQTGGGDSLCIYQSIALADHGSPAPPVDGHYLVSGGALPSGGIDVAALIGALVLRVVGIGGSNSVEILRLVAAYSGATAIGMGAELGLGGPNGDKSNELDYVLLKSVLTSPTLSHEEASAVISLLVDGVDVPADLFKLTKDGLWFIGGNGTRNLVALDTSALRVGSSVDKLLLATNGADRWRVSETGEGNLECIGDQEINVTKAPSDGTKLTNRDYVDSKTPVEVTVAASADTPTTLYSHTLPVKAMAKYIMQVVAYTAAGTAHDLVAERVIYVRRAEADPPVIEAAYIPVPDYDPASSFTLALTVVGNAVVATLTSAGFDASCRVRFDALVSPDPGL